MRHLPSPFFPAKAGIQVARSGPGSPGRPRIYFHHLGPRLRGGSGRWWLAFVLLLGATGFPALAEDRQTSGGDPRAGVWGLDPEATSATLARDGWKFLGLSTLSWPDGRQAVVTMWNSKIGEFAR